MSGGKVVPPSVHQMDLPDSVAGRQFRATNRSVPLIRSVRTTRPQ